MKFKIWVILIAAHLVFAGIHAGAMPIHPDIVKQIKVQPPDVQSRLLSVPDGVNQPVFRADRGRVTQASAVVLLVDFSDNPADPGHPPETYDTLLFSTGTYPTGSMQDYYSEVSYDQFTVDGLVPLEWYRMPQTYAYYVDGQRGFGSYPNNAQKMVEDAIAAADVDVDFSNYDSDNDGYVDALFVVHAGPGYEETGNPDMIHSHQWDLAASPNGQYQTDDGVKIGPYSVEPEEHANGDIISIGVFCHEFGHVLGLPDLYDYDYDSEGIGNWGIMAGGSWGGDSHSPETPVHFTAWSKIQLGWLTPTILSVDADDVTAAAVENSPVVYRFIDSGQEYFLLENRQKTGFDMNLFNSGLVIWHVDDAMYNNDHQCVEPPCEAHYRVALEQADGRFDLEYNVNRGDDGDTYPGSSGNRIFNTESIPNSWDYTAQPTWVGIDDISDSGDTMTFDATFSPTQPFLIYQSYDITLDDDGDGIPEAGETIEFTVTMTNYGLAVSSVTVTLITDGPVTVSDGSAMYGDFAGGEEKNNAGDPFRIVVDQDASRGARVECTLQISGDGGFTQNLAFSMAVSPLPIDTTPSWQGVVNYSSASCAADIDGNGFPDLAVANFMDQSGIYWNPDGTLDNAPNWKTSDSPTAFAILDVDLQNDQYLELIFINVEFDPQTFEYFPARSTLYANTTGIPNTTPLWQSQLHASTSGAVGDVDGDSIPDLVLGCSMEANVIYRGLATGVFEETPFWSSSDVRDTAAVGLADMDADGDLDVVAGNADDFLIVYTNTSGTPDLNPSWMSTSKPSVMSMAVADMNLDGYPEIALGTFNGPNVVFTNTGGIPGDTPSWQSDDSSTSYDIAWGDVDNDGYPELTAANMMMGSGLPEGRQNGIYYNTNGVLTTYQAWLSDTVKPSFSVGFADFDDDNDLDLFAVNLAAAPEMFTNALPGEPPCDTLGVEILMPFTEYHPGDTCYCDLRICNPDTVTYSDVPVFVILDVYGLYFFAPSFSDFDYYTQTVESGTTTLTILPVFTWPDGVGTASGILWYAAMTDAAITQLFGEMDIFTFGWAD
jgi:immune inhibitor A